MKIRLSVIDYFAIGIAVVALVCALLLPDTGELVLLDEACLAIVVFVVGVRLLIMAIVLSKKEKFSRTVCMAFFVTAVFLGVFGASAKSIAVDFVHESETITLTECNVERETGILGIFSLKYALTGIDENGQMQKYKISGQDYEYLASRETVTIECYINTKRIVSY